MFTKLLSWNKSPTSTYENDILFIQKYAYSKPKQAIPLNSSILKIYNDNGKIVYTSDFFMEAYYVHKIPTYYGYNNLFKEMKKRYPVLESELFSNFKDECKTNFPKIKLQIQNETNQLDKKANKKDSSEISNFQYMWENGVGEIETGQWSETKTSQYIDFLNKNARNGNIFYKNSNKEIKIDWMKIARTFKRSGQSCYDKYHSLKKQNKIQDLFDIYDESDEKKTKSFIFNPKFTKALTKKQEEKILNQILNLIDEGKPVSTYDLSRFAYYEYYAPENLAGKAVINSWLKQKKKPFNDDGDVIIPNFQSLVEELLDDTDDTDKFMKRHTIPKFLVSRTWIFSYMKRNGLTFRKPHSEKRTEVHDDEVDLYLNLLADAIVRYGVNRVLNMDETHIKTFASQDKTIALKGQETIKLNDDGKDLKEGTTYIGTICYNPEIKFPLVIIAKGETKACEQKYKSSDSEEDYIIHSDSGWNDSYTMDQYLNWLADRMDHREFALILDKYPSHIDESISISAKYLGIHLIYVPAGATGLLQPLDRRVFGVLKASNKKDQRINPVPLDIKRFSFVHNETSRNFKQISDRCNESAFNGIPGLDSYLPTSSENERNDDDYFCQNSDSDSL